MSFADGLLLGLDTALSLENLLYCLLGVTIGMVVGVLPGIGHLTAISLLLPLTFYAPVTAGIVMLAGIYYGAQYGGSIASIMVNLPGTASSAVICLDGHPMAKQGRAGAALIITTLASFFGSMVAIALLVALSPPLARAALTFHSADYFSMMALGLVAAGTLIQGRALIGAASVMIGLWLGIVGTDVSSGALRFTFGQPELYDGVGIVVIAMAFFGVSEVVSSIGRDDTGAQMTGRVTLRSLMPTRGDLKTSLWPMARGSMVGSGVGILPGAGGGSMASFMAYAVEKRVSRTPEKFGSGMVEGISAPESANNAAAQSAFIPTLTLGIPGDPMMALILGALLVHGVTPGPTVLSETPELFWGLAVSFLIGNLMLLILNIPLMGVWVRLLQIPRRYLFPAITLFIAIGCYSASNVPFDVLLVAGLGLVAYLLVALGFEPAPLLLGFVLGPLIEENFRRAMLISRGDAAIFVERPISAAFLLAAVALVVWVAAGARKRSPNPA
jgi:TctA family transporter